MIKYFTKPWKKAFDYKGITSRKEFWFYQLFSIVLLVVLNVTQNLITNLQYASLGYGEYESSILAEIFAIIGQTLSIFTFLFLLGNIIVQLSIRVRRLRDISKKWTWMFIHLIPILGILFFELYFMTRPSKHKDKKNEELMEEKSLKEKLADIQELFEKKLISEDEYKNLKSTLLNS